MRELSVAITRNGLLLAGFALLTSLLVASTFLGTRDAIAVARRAAAEKALLEIVPRHLHDNSLLDDTIMADADDPLLQLDTAKPIYIARLAGVARTALIPARAPDGYSGPIDFVVGVNRDGTIAGLRVLEHRETPGLGDAVDHRKSDWVEGFRGRSLTDPLPDRWTVKKNGGDFDQFTGATITPRAVVRATARVLQYARTHQRALFGAPDSAADDGAEAGQGTADATEEGSRNTTRTAVSERRPQQMTETRS